MNKDLISVIIPAYNAEPYLAECVSSIISSSIDNIEIIIVNDGSTDNTKVIAEAFAETNDNITVIDSPNCGVSHARNMGIECANGEYIMFVDADDALFPNTCEIMLSCIKEYDCDIVCGESAEFYDKITSSDYADYTGKHQIWKQTDMLMKSLEDHKSTWAVWGKLFKRSYIGNTRFLDGCRIHEDSLFLFECFLKNTTMLCIDACIYNYRINPKGASRADFSDKYMDILLVCDRKVELLKRGYPHLEDKSNNLIIKANMALLCNLCKTYSCRYGKIQKDCLKKVRELKRYFIGATAFDTKLFKVIIYRGFFAYKMIHFLRGRFKKLTNGYAKR